MNQLNQTKEWVCIVRIIMAEVAFQYVLIQTMRWLYVMDAIAFWGATQPIILILSGKD
jgi:hypothetical protein